MLKGMLMMVGALLMTVAAQAQFSIGPRAGLGSSRADLKEDFDAVKSGDTELGVHVGAFVRIGSEDFYIQPEVIYSSTSSSVIFSEGGAIDQVFETDLNKIDIPFIIGLRPMKLVSVQGGLVGSILVDQDDTKPDQLADAFRNYEDFTLGFQAGVGLELSSLLIDVRYEGNFSDVASDKLGPFEFDERQPQVKALLGFKLF